MLTKRVVYLKIDKNELKIEKDNKKGLTPTGESINICVNEASRVLLL